MDQISLTWYFDEPIDFEYKQYIILGYLQHIDNLFLKREISPHLLFLEKMSKDMIVFKKNIKLFESELKKNDYVYLFDSKIDLSNEVVDEVIEIVDYSLPQIQVRVKNGEYIAKKYNLIYY